jgi:CbbQ/NirQ/NorQ C-terminal
MLALALHALGDRVALYGFYSQGRSAVHLVQVKSFDDDPDLLVMRRLGGLVPGRYTRLGAAIRRAAAAGLREVASTRVLIAAGRLAAAGLRPRDAARAAVAGPLTDDPLLTAGLIEMIDVYLADGQG